MEWLLVPYFALFNRIRGWSFIDWRYGVGNSGIAPKPWEKFIEVMRGKYFCAVYMALPFIVVSPYYAALASLGFAVLFSLGTSPIFHCIHLNQTELVHNHLLICTATLRR